MCASSASGARWAPYEIAEIRLRQGDLRAAEEAFERADEMARSPQPGLALVRLAQGKPAVARSMVDEALADTHLHPARLGLSAASCEIALATGDLTTARDATDEILRIASAYGTPGMEATAASAAGALALAEGDTEAALVSLRRGWHLWQDARVPYEAARTRELLARAHRARGDADAASLDLRAAGTVFERLGAALDTRRVTDAV
jgi:tetratricopeptide (TPR) repeat protein